MGSPWHGVSNALRRAYILHIFGGTLTAASASATAYRALRIASYETDPAHVFPAPDEDDKSKLRLFPILSM